MKIFAVILLLVINAYAIAQTPLSETINVDCRNGVCIDKDTTEIKDKDVDKFKEILKETELKNLKYEIIKIKTVIPGSVYLLSASKPHYYGVEIVLSKEASGWVVLKKIESIY